MDVFIIVITSVFDLAAILFGARVFRGRGEAIDPARPWWRMTARPKLSRRLGILFGVLSALGVIALVLAAWGVSPLADPVSSAIGVLESVVIAYLYLNSAVRLKRLGVRAPAKEPKFRPTIKLKS